MCELSAQPTNGGYESSKLTSSCMRVHRVCHVAFLFTWAGERQKELGLENHSLETKQSFQPSSLALRAEAPAAPSNHINSFALSKEGLASDPHEARGKSKHGKLNRTSAPKHVPIIPGAFITGENFFEEHSQRIAVFFKCSSMRSGAMLKGQNKIVGNKSTRFLHFLSGSKMAATHLALLLLIFAAQSTAQVQ